MSPVANQRFLFVGAGGARVTYLEETNELDPSGEVVATTYTLMALHRDGSVEKLHSFGLSRPVSIVLSPDGRHWMWAELKPLGGIWHSELHLWMIDASGGYDHLVAYYETDSALIPYSWDEAGAIVAYRRVGLEPPSPLGPGAMGAKESQVWLVNPASGGLYPLWRPDYSTDFPYMCDFHALAQDRRTVACLTGSVGAGYTIRIGERGPDVPMNFEQLPIAIPLDRTRFYAAGSISFKPGPSPSLVAIGGCTQGWTQCSTDLIDVQSGAIRRFGPDGLSPLDGSWIWLDDGSLVEISDAGWTGRTSSPPATFIVSQSGSAQRLTTGVAVGVLRG